MFNAHTHTDTHTHRHLLGPVNTVKNRFAVVEGRPAESGQTLVPEGQAAGMRADRRNPEVHCVLFYLFILPSGCGPGPPYTAWPLSESCRAPMKGCWRMAPTCHLRRFIRIAKGGKHEFFGAHPPPPSENSVCESWRCAGSSSVLIPYLAQSPSLPIENGFIKLNRGAWHRRVIGGCPPAWKEVIVYADICARVRI